MRLIDLTKGDQLPSRRPSAGFDPEVSEAVADIISEIKGRGDAALRKLTERFDGVTLSDLEVPPSRIQAAREGVAPKLMAALEEAASRIKAIAERQLAQDWSADIGGGKVGESFQPVERVGLYVPGGRATYPSTVLMGAVPAQTAGVGEIIMCTPPAADGGVAAPSLAAAALAGVDRIFAVGGAQAIAALAYGTESVSAVDIICGPGNVYVAAAKSAVAGDVEIDVIAGPSEIAVIADEDAEPGLVAWDIVAQAEHGPGGSFWVITWSANLLGHVDEELEKVADQIGASDHLRESLERVIGVSVENKAKAFEACRAVAPEHVELIYAGAETDAWGSLNAGAVFAGRWSPVPLGDYIAGTNHILPTGGSARWSSGLRASRFQRSSQVVVYDEGSLQGVLHHVKALAETEGLEAHWRATEARFPHDRKRDD